MYVIIDNKQYPIDTADETLLAINAAPPDEDLDVYDDGEKTGEVLDLTIDHAYLALAKHLECSPLDVSNVHGDTYESSEDPGEYLVLTDSEREDYASEALQSYLDEHILSQIPEDLQSYFDGDAWKQDALDNDGYGHTLSGYDGHEHEVVIDGTYYYIYRVN